MPSMPGDLKEASCEVMYRFRPHELKGKLARRNCLERRDSQRNAAGQEILETKYGVAAMCGA